MCGCRGRTSNARNVWTAASSSYDVSSERRENLCGLKVSDTTIREIAQGHGARANAWIRSEPEAARPFRDAEFTTDGTCVNTTVGWREMKIGIFSKRDRGEPATPDEWATRTLPSPQVRLAFAAIEKSGDFGRRWKAWRKRRGLPDASVAATAWLDEARTILLHQGWRGLDEFVQRRPSERTAPQQAAVDALRNSLAPHQHHLNYAQRLVTGQSIGSGQVEGACKNHIGRRRKQTGARWRTRRANRMAGLCSLMYSHQWNTYWQTQ